MLTYRATEKDCASVEGTAAAAECVICFEEYEVGDEMARLECLCRFHKVCAPLPIERIQISKLLYFFLFLFFSSIKKEFDES